MKDARQRKDRSADPAAAPGFAARALAAEIIETVLRQRRAFDDELNSGAAQAALAELRRTRPRANACAGRNRVAPARHLTSSHRRVARARGAGKAPRVETALLLGAAQILFLDVPDHAAVDLSVRLARADRQAMHFAALVNAVLRRVAREGAERLAALDTVMLDTPPWLMARWIRLTARRPRAPSPPPMAASRRSI